MTRELTFAEAPDLKRIYARAATKRGGSGGDLPDVRATRTGVVVDPRLVAAYARVCRFPLRDAVPPTYAHMLAFPLQMAVMSDPGFPLPLLGAVHVENEIRAARPLRVGDEIDLSVRAENLRPHRRGRQVDLVSEVTSGGETVWRGVSTYLARSGENPDAPRGESPALDALDTVTSGPQWRVGTRTGREYAAVSGDWNPIHVHALLARPLGFPTAIAHGMYTYARALAALGPRLPDEGLTSRVWFRKPVRLPSTVRMRTAFEDSRTLSVVESASKGTVHALVENAW
jgi:acyl dehydratase